MERKAAYSMNLLEVKGIGKKYKGFELKDISFDLPAGYIMGYVGQNGAGKTTTLNMITGLTQPTEGIVRLNDITITENPVAYKEMIGYISDTSFFPTNFTISEVRRTLQDFYPTFHESTFNDYLDRWDLNVKKQIKDFSKGMKVKLMFADILSRDTRILLLDEATNGLDPVVKDEILSLMQEYIADGQRSILFSTHILSDLEQIADYIYFIDKGEKVLFEPKDELIESYLLLKAGPEELNEELQKHVIGIKKNSIVLEGLIKSDDAILFSRDAVLERATVDQIVIHYILERKNGGKTA